MKNWRLFNLNPRRRFFTNCSKVVVLVLFVHCNDLWFLAVCYVLFEF